MKLLLITAAALALTACAPSKQCGLPNEPVVIGTAKDGNLIYDDQAPLNAPCSTVTPPRIPQPPVSEPPVSEPQKGNNGWGNGDQDAPGGSERNNNAENNGGNHNGRDEAPGRSWHE